MSAYCPTCGRKHAQKRTALAPVDTAVMTDTQLFAHYKKTAIAGDLAFFLSVPILSPELRAQAEAITTPTRADITKLRTLWRMERQAYELANNIPAIGSPTWAEAQKEQEAAA